MRKRSVSVEWHVADSEAEWEALRAGQATNAAASASGSRSRWITTLLLLFVMGGTLWYWQSRQDAALSTLEEHAAGATVDGLTAADVIATPTMITSTNRTTATAQVTLAPLPTRPELFTADVARMLERPEWGIHAYQETTGQLRTILAGALWGAPRELTTTYFHLHFRQRDSQTITEAAPELDRVVESMRQNLGLPEARDKLIIQVSEGYIQRTAPYRPSHVDSITVSSPALYPPLEAWSTAELFTQSVVLSLVDQLMAEAVDQYAIGAARDPLLDGYRLWQLWDLPLPLAEHRQSVVRWLYVELPGATDEELRPLPADYSQFCVLHTLWMLHPAQLGLPFLCTDQTPTGQRSLGQRVQRPPIQLPRLHAPIYPDEQADGQGRTNPILHPGEAIAFATVIEYIVVKYGRGRLPALLANSNQYNRWNALIPVLFAVSASQFETDWQYFMAQRYGTPMQP